MIQPTPLSRTPVLSSLAVATAADGAAFGLSLANAVDAVSAAPPPTAPVAVMVAAIAGQGDAVPGNVLPSMPSPVIASPTPVDLRPAVEPTLAASAVVAEPVATTIAASPAANPVDPTAIVAPITQVLAEAMKAAPESEAPPPPPPVQQQPIALPLVPMTRHPRMPVRPRDLPTETTPADPAPIPTTDEPAPTDVAGMPIVQGAGWAPDILVEGPLIAADLPAPASEPIPAPVPTPAPTLAPVASDAVTPSPTPAPTAPTAPQTRDLPDPTTRPTRDVVSPPPAPIVAAEAPPVARDPATIAADPATPPIHAPRASIVLDAAPATPTAPSRQAVSPPTVAPSTNAVPVRDTTEIRVGATPRPIQSRQAVAPRVDEDVALNPEPAQERSFDPLLPIEASPRPSQPQRIAVAPVPLPRVLVSDTTETPVESESSIAEPQTLETAPQPTIARPMPEAAITPIAVPETVASSEILPTATSPAPTGPTVSLTGPTPTVAPTSLQASVTAPPPPAAPVARAQTLAATAPIAPKAAIATPVTTPQIAVAQPILVASGAPEIATPTSAAAISGSVAPNAATTAQTTIAADPRAAPTERAAPVPAPIPAPVALAEASAAPMIVAGATAPAFRLFAQAIHDARRDETATDSVTAAPVAAVEQPRVALPVGDAQGGTLNLADHRWPHAMVDRIERLRDAASAAADAADTSIRLTPAALGTIDVSVRTEGDTVHVRFSAEQAATRTLLADAQPRLAELAEARGLKLGQASVDGGAAQQQGGQHGQRQQQTQQSRFDAPARAMRADEPEPETTRIA